MQIVLKDRGMLLEVLGWACVGRVYDDYDQSTPMPAADLQELMAVYAKLPLV